MAIDTLTSERARRALSHGGGIDGIIFTLMAGLGVGMVLLLLVVGLRSAETSATQAAAESHSQAHEAQQSEIGNE